MQASARSAPYLSVVVPVYNEEGSIDPLYRELEAALASLSGGVELVFVDDGSSDASLARLDALATKDERVRVVALDRNYGQTTALAAGFRAARGEVVATLDADLQNDPADIPKLLAYLDRADVVNGVRIARRDSWVRRLSSRIANAVRNWATGDSVSDVGCSLRVMRSIYLRRVKLYRNMHRFLPTLLRLEGARVIEVPVSHRPRRYGTSKYGIHNRLWAGLVDLAAVVWMQKRHISYQLKR